jgi:MFS transporter, UMF1 family
MMPYPPPTRSEWLAWSSFDFANSGYTTVILTAIYNGFFVSVIAPLHGFSAGESTLLWTVLLGFSHLVMLLASPLLGVIADQCGCKKTLLIITTAGCVLSTFMLALGGTNSLIICMVFLVLSSIFFSAGENLIAAFLPELAPPDKMGKLSAMGWSIGYLGGIISLLLCLAYIDFGQKQGQTLQQLIPHTAIIVAILFSLASLPTFLWLKERTLSQPLLTTPLFKTAYQQLINRWHTLHQHPDFFRFLFTLTVYQCGIHTVIVLAAIYAQQVMQFTTEQTIVMILLVNFSAAIGSLLFGVIQDASSSLLSLKLTLTLWIIAISLAAFSHQASTFWLAANLIGISMGASQSAARALVGQFSPARHHGEFFGLWGMSLRLSAIIGPLSYGIINYLTMGNHRIAILSTLVFFLSGLFLLFFINEQRGKNRANT